MVATLVEMITNEQIVKANMCTANVRITLIQNMFEMPSDSISEHAI